MQQLTIEHKNIKKDRRPGKGRALALSRRIYRLQNTNNMYYVESETRDDQYYLVKFKPDVVEGSSCSCKDNSTRHLKCKHLCAIEFAIKWGTIKDIDKIPNMDQNTSNNIAAVVTNLEVVTKRTTKSYLEDDYDF